MNRLPFGRSRPRLVRSSWLALLAACASVAVVASESALAQPPDSTATAQCTGRWTRCVDVCPPVNLIWAECEAHAEPNCEYDGGLVPCHNARFWVCGWNWPFRGNNEIRCGYTPITS